MIDGTPLKLGETTYTAPPLNLKAMRRLLPAINLLSTTGLPSDKDLDTVIDVVHSALARNYPELTKEEVEEALDTVNMRHALSVVLGQSGLEQGPVGNGQAAMSLSAGESSTGTSSPPQDGPTTM